MQEDSVWNFGAIEAEIHMEHSGIGSKVKGSYSVIVTFPDQDYRAQTSYV